MHRSRAVNWEIREAHRQEKIVIGVWLHRDLDLYAPAAMDPADPIVFWNTDEITDLLDDEYDEEIW